MIGAASVQSKSCVRLPTVLKKVLHRAKKPDFGTMKKETRQKRKCVPNFEQKLFF
jgi:hypothetical protein